ncbi:MAG: Nitrogen regulatory protein P-II [Elusimicrobia bacterium]|nr:Nitrogen regulatory protein P-II [Elusimicrobiota bacterium]
MKKIEAVIRPDSLDSVLAALEQKGYPGIMVTEIEGHGKQKGVSQQWRGQEYKVDLLPKVKLEVVVSDKEVEEIVATISKVTKTGQIGDGKIFITNLAEAVRIRTGERGDSALN